MPEEEKTERKELHTSNAVSTAQFLTFLLRSLGYQDGVDFTWESPWALTDQLGVTNGEYNASTTFLRADAVTVSASALYAPVKNSDKTLLQTLLDSGAITGSTVVIWDYTPILFDEDVASFLFYPVAGSPASFTKEEDTLDGRFDSGSSHFASMKKDQPGHRPHPGGHHSRGQLHRHGAVGQGEGGHWHYPLCVCCGSGPAHSPDASV